MQWSSTGDEVFLKFDETPLHNNTLAAFTRHFAKLLLSVVFLSCRPV